MRVDIQAILGYVSMAQCVQYCELLENARGVFQPTIIWHVALEYLCGDKNEAYMKR